MQSNYCYVSYQHFFIHSGRQVDNRAEDIPLMRQRCQTNGKLRRHGKIKSLLNAHAHDFRRQSYRATYAPVELVAADETKSPKKLAASTRPSNKMRT
jgi:hypothetical protein